MKFSIFRFLPLLLLAGCGAGQVSDFAAGTPPMQIEQYFPGHSIGHGMFFDRFGKVQKQFTVDMDGAYDGKVLTIAEHFAYSDGTHPVRHWTFRPDGANGWIGTAPDVNGEAIGHWDGNAFRMRYSANINVDGHMIAVDFDDWMFRQDQRVVLNHSMVDKFGVYLGQVQLVFIHDKPTGTTE